MRTLGLELLEASAGYEGLVVTTGVETAAIAGLVARQRRLMRSAYRLADADERLEAQTIVRAQVEFLIVQKWLQLDPELHFRVDVKRQIHRELALLAGAKPRDSLAPRAMPGTSAERALARRRRGAPR